MWGGEQQSSELLVGEDRHVELASEQRGDVVGDFARGANDS
jgi:hypothetical protein